MNITVTKMYRDKHTKVIHKAGEAFEVEDARGNELIEAGVAEKAAAKRARKAKAAEEAEEAAEEAEEAAE